MPHAYREAPGSALLSCPLEYAGAFYPVTSPLPPPLCRFLELITRSGNSFLQVLPGCLNARLQGGPGIAAR